MTGSLFVLAWRRALHQPTTKSTMRVRQHDIQYHRLSRPTAHVKKTLGELHEEVKLPTRGRKGRYTSSMEKPAKISHSGLSLYAVSESLASLASRSVQRWRAALVPGRSVERKIRRSMQERR